ncbi:MAG: hypothetical protein HON53_16270, partial [Planctomycetaceae bacterium]|nr:hypothetical protein [Planctomycetaceae bacterium]
MSFCLPQRWIVCVVMGFVAASLPGQLTIGEEASADSPVEAPVPKQLYHLRYKFQRGDTVFYDEQQRTTKTIKGGGLVDVTKTETSARKHYRVVSVDGVGTGLLELELDRVKMQVDFGNGAPLVKFDSESKEPPPSQFRPMMDSIGKPQVRMRLAANGELKKVQLLNRSNQRAVGQLRSAPRTDASDPSHNFLVVFPQESIAVGHSWSDRIAVDVRTTKTLLRPITLLRRYSLTSVKDGLATVSISTRILTPIRDPKILTQLIQRTPSGTAVFDLDRGVIVEKTMTINKRQV